MPWLAKSRGTSSQVPAQRQYVCAGRGHSNQ